MNDLDFVVRTVDLLWSHSAKTWVSGTWGEELRALVPPQTHTELELLYPAPDWPPAGSAGSARSSSRA